MVGTSVSALINTTATFTPINNGYAGDSTPLFLIDNDDANDIFDIAEGTANLTAWLTGGTGIAAKMSLGIGSSAALSADWSDE